MNENETVDNHTTWCDSLGRQIIDENGIDDLKDELIELLTKNK